MEAKFTPGPWRWFGNAKNREVYLATVNCGRQCIMGFCRWGMSGAQPMFQPAGRRLVPAADLLRFEVGNRSVVGVESAKADDSVYRLDIRDIDCADAHLISSAPDLFMLALQYRDDLLYPPSEDSRDRRIAAIDAAIAKATGR